MLDLRLLRYRQIEGIFLCSKLARNVNNVKCQVSSVKCRVASVECRVSSVECQVRKTPTYILPCVYDALDW